MLDRASQLCRIGALWTTFSRVATATISPPTILALPLALERGDHQLYWKRMATASRERPPPKIVARRPVGRVMEALMAKLDVFSSLHFTQGRLIERANFGQNGLIGRRFFSRRSRVAVANYSCSPVALR